MLYLEIILSSKILYCYFAEAKHRKFSKQLEEDLCIRVWRPWTRRSCSIECTIRKCTDESNQRFVFGPS